MAVEELERITLRKVTLRLIPFMFLLYIVNYLDRYNVSVAALTMKTDLHFSDQVYGIGAGIFFIGYFFFEVPSNLFLEKVGARFWIARIMITWGIIASSMMFIHSVTSFYVLRLLLGVAEAGFFPGMVLYLTYWFPARARGRAFAQFMVATTISGIVGGPLGAVLLKMNGVFGLKGWQWIFLAEGLPAFVLGIAVLFFLSDKPKDAKWLSDEERNWLVGALQREGDARKQRHNLSAAQALHNSKVLLLCLLFFLMGVSGAGLGMWAPQILKLRSGWSDTHVLIFGTIPGLFGAVSMVVAAIISDRMRERRLFLVGGLALCVVGMTITACVHGGWPTIAALTVLGIGGAAANAPFWTVATGFLSGTAAAGCIAFINSVGNLSGFVGPTLIGFIKQHTQSYDRGLFVLAGISACAALLASRIRHDVALEHGDAIPAAEAAAPATVLLRAAHEVSEEGT